MWRLLSGVTAEKHFSQFGLRRLMWRLGVTAEKDFSQFGSAA
jgi:hypothetical protein